MAEPTAPDLRSTIEAVARELPPEDYEGWDWFQLSTAEQEVFEIEPERLPLMVSAWGAYEAFHDIVQGSDWDMNHQAVLDAAKAARPDLAAEPCTMDGWIRFAVAFSDLAMREAWKWWMKNETWLERNGVKVFQDEGRS